MVTERQYTTIVPENKKLKGQWTYEERIELGRVFQGGKSNAQICREAIKALHPNVEHVAINETNLDYTMQIYEGIKWWSEQEKERLAYTPTAEEKAAGVSIISEMGTRGTATAIGKDYGVAPSDIYKWIYGDVFTILERDIKIALYKRRYQANEERKRKQHQRGRRR